MRCEQHGLVVHTPVAVQRRAEGQPELREPDSLPGGGDRWEHGAGRGH